MSTITATAELEAAIAEAELTDDEAERVAAIVAEDVPVADAIAAVLAEREPGADDDDTQPPPATDPTEPTDKQLGELDREQSRHEKAVHKIMGAFVEGFNPCESCGGVGLVPPAPQLQTNDLFKACDTCRGWGVVKTGALDPQNATRACPGCRGRGYLEKIAADGTPLAEQGATAPIIAAPMAPPPLEPPPTITATPPGEARYGVPSWMGDPQLGA